MSFEQAVLAAANLGDDADATAALVGQLAGAYYGRAGVPAPWLERLHLSTEIIRLADVPGPNLQPIGYATASDLPQPGATLTVSGWGPTKEGGAGSTQLLTVDVPVVDLQACNDPKSYDGVIARSMVCAGREQGGKDSCQGDSGGPAVLNATTTEPLLAGIVSWGHGCARPWKYGIYTRVGSFAPWVKKTIGAVRSM